MIEFPRVKEAHTVQDWLNLSPGHMCGYVQSLDWEEVMTAIQTLRALNPDGHLAHPTSPESVLRVHLCARMRRMFDPDILRYAERQR